MAWRIDLDTLLAACSDDSFEDGIRIDSGLEPCGGPGSPVKPAVYEGGVYQTDRRWASPSDDEPTDVIVIDNVPSQANRLEEALRRHCSSPRVPELVLDLADLTGLPAHLPRRISSWEFPHRNADAYLRDAQLEGRDFVKTDIGKSIFGATAQTCGPLMAWFPQALLYGFWQSHLGKKRSNTKHARAWVSEIIGWKPAAADTRVFGLKGDPLNLNTDEALISNPDDRLDWGMGKARIEGGKKDKLSEIGHGQVPFMGDQATAAAVSFARVTQRATVSFAQLRRVSLGPGQQAADASARALLVALGLHAMSWPSGADSPFGRGPTFGQSTPPRCGWEPTAMSPARLAVRRKPPNCLVPPSAKRDPRVFHSMVGIASRCTSHRRRISARPFLPAGRSWRTSARDRSRAAARDLPRRPGRNRQHRRLDPRGMAARARTPLLRDRGCRRDRGSVPCYQWFRTGMVRATSAASDPRRCRPVPSATQAALCGPARRQCREVVSSAIPWPDPVEIRPGVRVAPRQPHVVYVWDVQPPCDVVDALRRRAARVGYLGAADSPVRLRVGTSAPEPEACEEPFVPDPAGTVAICVPEHGDLQVLDAMYHAWTEHGASVARTQFGALRHQVSYRAPGRASRQDLGTVVAWLRLEDAVSGRRVSVVTDLFKKAVLSRYQDTHGEPPPVLHGHGFKGKGFDLARFLALPDVGFPRSRGRIHGLALWLPPDSTPDLRSRVTAVAYSIRRLTGGGVDVAVSPWIDEVRPVAANPARWTRKSRCWVTAFPALHERRVKLDLHELTQWCKHAGLPAPRAFRSARCPLVRGAVDLAPVEANRPGRPGLPYSHLKIWFYQPVTGPVLIGAGRQRGLGLCVDADEREGDV